MSSNDLVDLNGRSKWIIGVASALVLALITWNFSAVYSLQVTGAGRDAQIISLKSDLDSLKTSDYAFQGEVRNALNQAQVEMRVSVSRVADILTELRIKLGNNNGGSGKK